MSAEAKANTDRGTTNIETRKGLTGNKRAWASLDHLPAEKISAYEENDTENIL